MLKSVLILFSIILLSFICSVLKISSKMSREEEEIDF